MSYSLIKKINDALNSKKISAKELASLYLEKIKSDDTKLNSYVYVTDEVALKQAEAIDQKIAQGEQISMLSGVPMTLKDNISTNGIKTECCSKMLEGYEPIYDATAWELLSTQGAVLLGKTNMDEFAMGSTCENSVHGGALNPHNLDYVAGGSSGGGASAVSANLACYALGSDTGGSIRQPASFCGVVGFKPTYGAVSRYGLIAFASSLDQIGPITKSVEDASIVFDAISAKDTMDSTCSGSKATYNSLNDSIQGKNIALVKELMEDLSDDVKEAVDKSVKKLEELGANIKTISIPEIHQATPCYYIIACAEASSNLGRYDGIRYGYKASDYTTIHDMVRKSRTEGFGAEVKRRIMLGTYVLSAGYFDAYYNKAQMLRGAIKAKFSDAFKEVDAIIAPTFATAAFKKGFASMSRIESYKADLCTVPVNIAGLPSCSIPSSFSKEDNMPLGVQIICDSFNDATCLNIAHMLEKSTRETAFKDTDFGVHLDF